MAQGRERPNRLRSKKQFGNSSPFSKWLSTQSFLAPWLARRLSDGKLVDYAVRDSGRLRVARHGGKEAVKVAAALHRPRWRNEEEDEEQCAERTLHHRPSFTIPFVPAQAGIRDVPDPHKTSQSTSDVTLSGCGVKRTGVKALRCLLMTADINQTVFRD